MRIPNHIGIIPDGNRRWARSHGLNKEDGYEYGLKPGLELLRQARQHGIHEITYYGFTVDNCKRATVQQNAFKKACVDAVKLIASEDSSLLVVGNTKSPNFPEELIPYTNRKEMGKGGIKVNFLVNYGWEWDVENIMEETPSGNTLLSGLHSKDISRIDMIIRWGNMRRLSGFLPLQSVYSDFYIVEDMWPDFAPEHLTQALKWYDKQDITLGG